MTATWYQGAAEEFIRKSRAAWEAGAHVVHALSGTSIELSGSKAVAQTRMMFSLRTRVHEVPQAPRRPAIHRSRSQLGSSMLPRLSRGDGC